MKYNCYLLLVAASLLASCGNKTGRQEGSADSVAIRAINDSSFARHIQVLASDAFLGRKPFTAGEDKTINYLKDQFSQLGLQPGNGDSYFQEVPLVEIGSKPEGALVVKGKSGSVTLNYLEDYVAGTERAVPQVKVENSDWVFAGFGIVAPEYNWNDYAGLDVKGKTVLVMVNDPGFYDSTLFKGKTMTYYGRWTYKFEEAARQGATGIIIIHDTAPASYPWTVVRSGWSKSKLHLQHADDNIHAPAIEGWITGASASKLFQLAGVDTTLQDQAKRPGFKPVPLQLSASLTLNNSIKKSTSHNVLAVWPGTDRADEYIIYSAHWDHLGTGEAIRGDSIYNGAMDNASGTAALLEIAAAFTKLDKKPSRSILFLSVTAEEQGLLGSAYYAAHPIYPVKKTVADINMDVLNTFGRTKDITIIGLGQSELDDYAKAAAAKQDRVIVGEDNPSGGWFFRSDHFNFAKVGIPALYVGAGIDSREHGPAYGKAQGEAYGKERYHSPFDEFDPKWNMSGMVEDTRLLFDVGHRLSQEQTFPKWKTGSEFKAIREKP